MYKSSPLAVTFVSIMWDLIWTHIGYCPHFNLPPYSVIAGSEETIKSRRMPGLTLITTSKRVPSAMLIRKIMNNPNNGDKFSRYDGPVCNCFQTNSQYEETYSIALTNRGNDSLLIEVKDNQMSRKMIAMKQTNWTELPLTGYIPAGISCQSRENHLTLCWENIIYLSLWTRLPWIHPLTQ